MHKAEKFIKYYNSLNGKSISKKKLSSFHSLLQKEISAKHIDAHSPYGIELLTIKEKLDIAIKKMNGKYQGIDKLIVKPIFISSSKTKITPKFKKNKVIESNESGSKKPLLASKNLGFVSADKKPDRPVDTIRIPGQIGSFTQDLQPYKLVIVISGETHSSKSQLAMQLADAFAEMDYTIGFVDWEQGGILSADTQRSLQNNVKDKNKKKINISSEVPKSLDAVKSLAGSFDVIILDSGTKLGMITNAWIDELRDEYPDTIWIPLMQLKENGNTRGGSAAEFDAPVVIKTFRPDESDFKKNYAVMYKNRGNQTGLTYNIFKKKLITLK